LSDRPTKQNAFLLKGTLFNIFKNYVGLIIFLLTFFLAKGGLLIANYANEFLNSEKPDSFCTDLVKEQLIEKSKIQKVRERKFSRKNSKKKKIRNVLEREILLRGVRKSKIKKRSKDTLLGNSSPQESNIEQISLDLHPIVSGSFYVQNLVALGILLINER
jgi:hypothetical protein